MSRIILTMICKNEAPTIERALRSLVPHIAGWVINDTGSTDGTQKIIARVMRESGLPGRLIDSGVFGNFADARNVALDAAKRGFDKSDYALWLDADDALETEDGFSFQDAIKATPAEAYFLRVRTAGGTTFIRGHLSRLGSGYRWKWPVHEALSCPVHNARHIINGVTVRDFHEGARSRDNETYLRDTQALAEFLIDNQDDPRARYYHAQSMWSDAIHTNRLERGSHEWRQLLLDCREAHNTRAMMTNGWESERWYAALRFEMCTEWLGLYEPEQMADRYLALAVTKPLRAEAYREAERLYATAQNAAMAKHCRDRRMALKVSDVGGEIFVDPSAYGSE